MYFIFSGSSVDKDKYTLIIHDETRSDTHTIDYPGSKTVRGVKEDLSSVTDIPVRFQVWTGWPSGTTDTTVSCLVLFALFGPEEMS